jgi:tetratricopeptide (TPR) repeat protein
VIHGNIDYLKEHQEAFSSNNPYHQKFSFQFLFKVMGAQDTGYVPVGGELYTFALNKLEESQAKKDNFGYFNMALGIAYDQMGDSSSSQKDANAHRVKASEFFEKARLTLPDYPTVNMQYALNLDKRGKRTEGIKLLRAQIEKYPDFPNYHYYLGILLAKEKGIASVNESLKEMEFALDQEIDPQHILAIDAYYSYLFSFSKSLDKERLTTALERLKVIDREQSMLYDAVLDLVKSDKKIPTFNFSTK